MTQGTGAIPVWRKSSRCESGLCVEVAVAEQVHVRDPKHPRGLSFSRQSWHRFVTAIKAGELDRR